MPSSIVKRVYQILGRRSIVSALYPAAHGPRRVVATGCPGWTIFRRTAIASGFFIDGLLAICLGFKHAITAFAPAFARCIS